MNTETLISLILTIPFFISPPQNQIIDPILSKILDTYSDTLKTLKPSSSSLNIHSLVSSQGTSEYESRVTETGVNRIALVNPWSQIINDQLRARSCWHRKDGLTVQGNRIWMESRAFENPSPPAYYTRSCSMWCAHECNAYSTTSPRG